LTPQLLLHTTFWFLTLPPSPFREIHCIYHSKIASDDYPILKTVHSIPSHLPLEPPQLHSTKGGDKIHGAPPLLLPSLRHENHFTCLECALIILITSFIPSISSTSQPSRKRGRNGTSDEPAPSKRKLRASARDLPLPNHDSNDDEEGLANKDIIVKSYTSYLRNYHISTYRRLKQEFETISVLFNEMKAASGETNTRSASNAARTLVREVVKTFEKWLDYLDKTMRIISEDIQGDASQTAYSWDGYLVQKLVRRKWKAYEGLVEGFEATSFRGELPEPQIDKEDLVPLLNELPTMLSNIERHQWLFGKYRSQVYPYVLCPVTVPGRHLVGYHHQPQ
jgi:hypothetical protein